VVAAKSAENPFFAKVIDSQRKWAQRVVGWSQDVTVPGDIAYQHYFTKKS
jgi:TRAP-type mannitol/chloroaromatic compound transport system substrate-binding protein